MDAPRECIEQDAELHGLKPLPTVDYDEIRERLSLGQREYDQTIELGKMVYSVVGEGNVKVQSLSKRHKEALDIYINQKPSRDYTDILLRSWQEDALKLINPPTDRNVIWITGRQGNEGKTWFQGYLQNLYGISRVVRLDLRIKHANICNVLKKCALATIDVFLFNDARSNAGDIDVVYKMLEDLKDGQATGTKYNNDIIRFKTPNTVMVFSNRYPKLESLSRDRWIIYNANKDGLKLATQALRTMKTNGCDLNNTDDLNRFGLNKDIMKD